MDTKKQLSQSLIQAGFIGKITKVFSSSFNATYEVGLAELEDGRRVVVKIKQWYKGDRAEHSRSQEYDNLIMLKELHSSYIPEAIYYRDDVLIMSYIEGENLSKVGINTLPETEYVKMGRLLRKMNDLVLSKDRHLLKLNTLQNYFDQRVQHLINKRVNTKLFPKTFYNSLIIELQKRLVVQSNDLAIIWVDCNKENILADQNQFAGFIDFEDMVIGPKFIQLQIVNDLNEQNKTAFVEGYGEDTFAANFNETNNLIFRTLSSLNAVFLAEKENTPDWLEKSRQNLQEYMQLLDINITI